MFRNRFFPFWIFFAFIFSIGSIEATAQKSKQQLEKEREANKKKIEETSRILSETMNSQKATVGQLNALNEQIKTRKDMMSNINKEVVELNVRMGELEDIIEGMEGDLVQLKQEYGEMAHTAYKSQLSQNNLVFLFSAETFHDFVLRLEYMRQYSKARKNQMEMISLVKKTLEDQREEIDEAKQEKDQLLVAQMGEYQELENLQKKQKTVLAELKTRGRKLNKELKDRKKADEKLGNLIADVIRTELAKKSSAKKAAVKKADVAFVGADFANFRKKLEWPVASGFVSQGFGKHPHPALKGVVVENPGVDIQTRKQELVRAVHQGVVKTVAYVPGEMNTVVIVQHGDYFTVYAKLESSKVKVGEAVNAKDPIGVVHTDSDGKSELQFQVWKQKEKLNPQVWLRSR
ncbi:murein hydrolase activator EnvC [Persicobacter sp. CCB-QB2]|uniref:murein hydrolase activator EnvC family protein n=1 Tax=Persicobacter sp. CCB-QB2 TaxID=1561025 RepID=UPI0006A97BD4|nr:peptidoglycan DD-metalloendopeptidase family protein [Persicobacter sp. CCB-QB2]